ncbi:MAG: hypothetical protein LBQ87_05800 [Candidatus Fibromonas sp.]|nr:hypothetical protein [Candidatus Fibromonas sp.]
MNSYMNTAGLLFCFFSTLAFARQPSGEHPFDTLRGFAYNPYGTLGAAPAIADILRMPSDIYGHKFVYVSPVSNSGYSAFDLAGGSALLGFDQSLILGYAKSFYGLSLEISLDKFYCLKEYDDYECTQNAGYMRLNFSVPLGNSTLYAHTGKTVNENNITAEDIDITSKNSIKEMSIGITGGDILVWDFRLGLDLSNPREKRIYYDYENFSNVERDLTQTRPEFQFHLGYKILQGDRVKFIVGLNNWFFWQYIKYKTNYSYFYNQEEDSFFYDTHDIYIRVSPNFLGEVILTKHLLAFVGARHIISYDSKMETISLFSIANSGSDAYVGLRYGHKNWAVETRLQSDAFGDALDGNNPFISLGGFIWLTL